VQVVDRARFPRDKLCGDTVNPGAVALLRRHGLEGALRGARPVEGMIVTGPSGLRVEGRYGGGAYGRAIARRDLDARLVEAAADAGAAIEEEILTTGAAIETTRRGAIVTGIEAKGPAGHRIEMRARVVIAADGRHSRVAQALGLSRFARAPRRWAVGGYFENVDGLTSCGEMHIRPDRYLGVAPLPGGIVNACVVTTAGEALRNPEALLLNSLRADSALAERFASARLVSPAVCLGPMAVDCTTPGASGLLLAGDAAGFIDPMTGDGLRFALRGAELAADFALDVLVHGWRDAHLRLAAARRRVFRPKWRFNRTLRSLVASPASVRLADRGATIAPSVVRGLIRYAADLRAA
jgi:flavin-dependent dehydrogenase